MLRHSTLGCAVGSRRRQSHDGCECAMRPWHAWPFSQSTPCGPVVGLVALRAWGRRSGGVMRRRFGYSLAAALIATALGTACTVPGADQHAAREHEGLRRAGLRGRGRWRRRPGRAHLSRSTVWSAVDLRRRRCRASGSGPVGRRPRTGSSRSISSAGTRAARWPSCSASFDSSTIDQDQETLTLYYTDAELQAEFDSLPQWIRERGRRTSSTGLNAYVDLRLLDACIA